jgi:hypothetical protein
VLIGQKAWWIAATYFFIVGAAVLRHMVYRCTDEIFDDRHHINILMRRVLRLQMRCCLIGAAAAAATSVTVFTINIILVPVAIAVASPILGAVMVVISERGLNALYDDYGVSRHWRSPVGRRSERRRQS